MATIRGLLCSVVMIQAAATDCAQVPKLANRLAIQMMRNAGKDKGESVLTVRGAAGAAGAPGGRSAEGETGVSIRRALGRLFWGAGRAFGVG
ncbi:hypothetical protein QWC_24567 [Achromobacter marplatensis]|nr:hypothetical protein QWC_24567 [Achromobacter marplatensis]